MSKRAALGLLLVLCLCACGSSSGGAPAAADGDGGAPADASRPFDGGPGSDGGAGSDGAAAPDGAPHPDAATANDSGADGGVLRPSPLGGPPVQGSAGCGLSGAAGTQNLSMTVDGATRTGIAVIPAGYDPAKAYPLVFVFHGDGGTGAAIRTSLNLEPAAAGKAIFVYLDGANQTWDYTLTGQNQDMDFVLAARDSVRGQYCVDLGRTFATGMSRGGFFVNQLACRYGIADFTAMAPHSGTIEQDDSNAYVYGPPNPSGGPYTENGNFDFMCPVDGTPSSHPPLPALPPPMFIVHGQCDTESGVEFAEGRNTAEHWGFAARCASTPAVVTDPNPVACGASMSCPTTTTDPCYAAPGCAAGHDVTFCAIPEMGHAVWCNAATRIWAFFASH